jgi:hypothetical protein
MSRRLFIGPEEVDFFNAITKEVIQEIVGQQIIYFAVSDELTKADDLYGEALKKTVYSPVEMNALVLYQDPQQKMSKFTMDTIHRIEVYMHQHELEERGITPREGDFVKFGTSFYEIEKLTKPQLVYGQVENKVQIKAECRIARAGQFSIDG